MEEKLFFEWDEEKNEINKQKHGVSFEEAQYAFDDPKHLIVKDLEHSKSEKRYFCLGKVKGSILSVRFTYRGNIIRIFGAGFWRRGKKRYEKDSAK